MYHINRVNYISFALFFHIFFHASFEEGYKYNALRILLAYSFFAFSYFQLVKVCACSCLFSTSGHDMIDLLPPETDKTWISGCGMWMDELKKDFKLNQLMVSFWRLLYLIAI